MNELSINKVKLKIISLIVCIVLLLVFQRIKRYQFELIKREYILFVIIVSLVIVVAGILLFFLVPKLNFTIKKIGYFFLDFGQTLALAFVLVQAIFMFWFFPASVQGQSMMPTLIEKDRVIITVGNQKITRFDIVVIDSHDLEGVNSEDDLIIKRVIGLPGENFFYQDGKLYLIQDDNPILISEPHLLDDDGNFKSGPSFNTKMSQNISLSDICSNEECFIDGEFRIPDDYFFVLGDNRSNSVDSRSFGLIHRSKIIGKAKYIKSNLIQWKKIK